MYHNYNREERDLCAHLFRLLLEDQPNWTPLKTFLRCNSFTNTQLYYEAALLRDAYHERKPNITDFLELICDIIAQQNNIANFTKYSILPDILRDPTKTHPKQIYQKLKMLFPYVSKEDSVIYGCLQGMFNAKPDLAICIDNKIILYEAKLTLGFDQLQLARTRNIAEVWAKAIHTDIGYVNPPDFEVRTLGLKKYSPDISWNDVYQIALNTWGADDFSVKAFSKCLKW